MPRLESKDLELLLQDFYNLTGIRICLYDMDGNELFFYPNKSNSFCEILRSNQSMDVKCKNCDKIAFAHCKAKQSQYHYTCHAGLQECISPILYNNEVIGFMMLGQIKKSNSPDFSTISSDFPRELIGKLKSSYENLPIISDKKLTAAFHILDVFTGYDLLKNYIQSHNSTIDVQIKQYIHENISHSISVVQLCSRFHLSHYEVYHIFKEYFFCSPAEYIKRTRLKTACNMLVTTDLSVNKIAILCGIPDYNYFSKVFKATYSVSPTAFRKINKKAL